jgi:uncharacterized protein
LSEQKKICWVVTEGIAGTENQCIGVAEAMGITPVIKRVKLKTPWKQLSPWLPHCAKSALAADSAPISAPWPEIVIASGRKSIGVAKYIKKQAGDKTFVAVIQDPRVSAKTFDLVAVPQHDKTRGNNVLVTVGALHKVTPEKLDAARAQWEDKLKHLPHPRVAVIIGGSSKAHQLTPDISAKLAERVAGIDGGLMVTASRRTGAENEKILRDRIKGDNVFFWDGTGDNPYFGFLALADYIIVTEDSVSMTCEALSTGKPVYTAALEGGARRLDLFHRQLREQGFTRPFEGTLETWTYTPPRETQRVADAIRKAMK